MDIFASRLRQAIQMNNIQQKELAAISGLSAARISNYCTGYSEPSLDILCSLCRSLHVSADYLVGLSDTPKAESPLSVTRATIPRDPLADLTPERREKVQEFIDFQRQQQEKDEQSHKQEA